VPPKPGSEAGNNLPPRGATTGVDELGRLTIKALRSEWERLFRKPPPDAFGRDLLCRDIAYRLQELALGGLPQGTRRKLVSTATRSSTAAKRDTSPPRLTPGVTLVRDWHGTTHTVFVVDGGFEHQGQHYASLTEIARRITGAHWSGPRFFGLHRAPTPAVPRRPTG
jgi:Protein of unknown function (DUF2924)